jgi:MazG family protein
MSASSFDTLLELMARLRAPGGCPWDREQTLESLRRYLIEETYEVIDAIERKDWAELAEELGDVQLQIVFQSQIAKENGWFTVDDVLDRINEKLVRRHPHVFGDESADTSGQVLHRWEQIKADEKRRKGQTSPTAENGEATLLDSVPRSQPALLEARQISKKAAQAGFEWRHDGELIDKLREEIDELRAAQGSENPENKEEEVGDLLFLMVNVARRAGVDPELALKRANSKFRKRFGYIEQQLRRKGVSVEEADVEEMEQLWQRAKNQ